MTKRTKAVTPSNASPASHDPQGHDEVTHDAVPGDHPSEDAATPGEEEDADLPLTDDEVMRSLDAMKSVYLERKSNARAKRLLRAAIRYVRTVRRPVIPVTMLREGRALLVFGDSRAGKSTLMRRLLSQMPELRTPEDGRSRPLVDLQVKGPATLATLGIQILEAAGYPVESAMDEKAAWRIVYRRLEKAGTLVLHLGEMQNVSGTANAPERIKLRNTIRSLVINENHPMVVIMSGLPEIHEFIREDLQIRKRSSFVALERLSPEQTDFVAEGIMDVADSVNLELDEAMLKGEIVPRLLHVAHYQLGSAMEFAVMAAERALAPVDEEGDRLPPDLELRMDHFAGHYEETTGNGDWANPFVVDDWERVDVDSAGLLTLAPPGDEDDDAPAGGKAKGKAKKVPR